MKARLYVHGHFVGETEFELPAQAEGGPPYRDMVPGDHVTIAFFNEHRRPDESRVLFAHAKVEQA